MIRCIAIDDEPLALDVLEDFIKKVPFLQLVKCCQSAVEAIELLHQENIQLIFLDIQMPQISGVQFLKSLEHRPKVIFTTAYSDYALEGFNLDAVDYLLKPFTFERFLKAVNKAYQQINMQTAPPEQAAPLVKDYMFVKSGYDIIKVHYKDIRYIEGLKDYVKIHTDEKVVVSLMSMKTLADDLPEQFIRVHRSFIVNFERITLVQKRKVFIQKVEIPIGEVYRDAFFERLKQER
ncbi:two-component system LytT family response regulator [Catalinimonas alkaloidigena]|uniref:LytR/AlgR family response regulator transcription factor n=1 Tax=Catalinimonas alkaloidigena TaxID=1075417 RepID=UPI002404EA06|nr:LytTR family DNA-binding domain-containing protein [Catalinimonas alkaloidigena]MDF9795192.1 two-component system LytT family response regulator [Catalinimonas alkaloidigena]